MSVRRFLFFGIALSVFILRYLAFFLLKILENICEYITFVAPKEPKNNDFTIPEHNVVPGQERGEFPLAWCCVC